MVQRFVAASRREVEQDLEAAWQQPGPLHLDFSSVTTIDSVGAALLASFAARAKRAQRPLRISCVQPSVAALLRHVQMDKDAPPSVVGESFVETVGSWGYACWTSFVSGLVLLSELAYLLADSMRGSKRRVRGLRWLAVVREAEDMGAQATPIVALIAFLVGVTIALQSAAQLRPYGAVIYMVDLMAVSVTRELGPLLAAILVAGRSGSACAAQLATMVVTEEIDALRAMGLEPNAFTVLPKVIALVFVQPMVTLCACAAAIFGAYVVALLALDIPSRAFWLRLAEAVRPHDVYASLAKSMVFGLLIVVVAVRCGLAVRGGAEGVGRSTTRSVVRAIFCIIAADAAFSFLLYSSNP